MRSRRRGGSSLSFLLGCGGERSRGRRDDGPSGHRRARDTTVGLRDGASGRASSTLAASSTAATTRTAVPLPLPRLPRAGRAPPRPSPPFHGRGPCPASPLDVAPWQRAVPRLAPRRRATLLPPPFAPCHAREEGVPGGGVRRGCGWRRGSWPAREEGAPGGGSARPLEEGEAEVAVVAVVFRAVCCGRRRVDEQPLRHALRRARRQ